MRSAAPGALQVGPVTGFRQGALVIFRFSEFDSERKVYVTSLNFSSPALLGVRRSKPLYQSRASPDSHHYVQLNPLGLPAGPSSAQFSFHNSRRSAKSRRAPAYRYDANLLHALSTLGHVVAGATGC